MDPEDIRDACQFHAMKRVLWWLIAGTKGGVNRARMINALNDRPYNANQLSEVLKLDYKTIRHHLKVLSENNVVTSTGSGYGSMYFLSQTMEENYALFEEIWDKIGNKFK
jgi:DNA-binding transcriptional ArsR family regulator